MTKIPSSLLRETLTVTPLLGSSAYGPKFGTAFKVRARVEGKRRLVRRPGGDDIISSATAIVRPDVAITVGSKADHGDRSYEVLDVLPGEGLTRPAFLELVLS